jgi:hypothetical protein
MAALNCRHRCRRLRPDHLRRRRAGRILARAAIIVGAIMMTLLAILGVRRHRHDRQHRCGP